MATAPNHGQASPSYLQRHQSAKPSPQYGSRQMAICREEYSSHWSLMALQRALTAEWDICKARDTHGMQLAPHRHRNRFDQL